MSQQEEHNSNEKNNGKMNQRFRNDKINTANQAKIKRKKKKNLNPSEFLVSTKNQVRH